MEKIDYEAIIDSERNDGKRWWHEENIESAMKKAVEKAIILSLQTVANEAVVDYNIISLEKGGEIETYIIQGSLDSIKEKLLKELL